MTVKVHIGRLVLDGIDARHVRSDLLAEAIRREFAGRIGSSGLPAQLESSSMRPAAAGVSPEPIREVSAKGLGASIGGALYGSFQT